MMDTEETQNSGIWMVHYWSTNPWASIWVFTHPCSHHYPGGGNRHHLLHAGSASHDKAVIQGEPVFYPHRGFGSFCFAGSVGLSNKCPLLHQIPGEMFCSLGWILSIQRRDKQILGKQDNSLHSTNVLPDCPPHWQWCMQGRVQSAKRSHSIMQWLWPKDFKKMSKYGVFYLFTIKIWTAYLTWPENELLLTFPEYSGQDFHSWSLSTKHSNNFCNNHWKLIFTDSMKDYTYHEKLFMKH